MAIIKYRVEVRNAGASDKDSIESVWQYEEITAPNKNGKLLKRDEALERIREKGLVMVCKNDFGTIWDLPLEPLLEEFEGFYSQKGII